MPERPAYQGRFVRVTEEEIAGAVYERVYIRNAITIFPVDARRRILFIKEKRVHERPSVRWKPVTGFYEDGASLEANANRELQEEIGVKAARIEPLFEIVQTGTLNLVQHFVLAKGLSDSKLPNPDGEDTILEVAALDLEEIARRTLSGELVRGAAGYGLLKLYLDVQRGALSLA